MGGDGMSSDVSAARSRPPKICGLEAAAPETAAVESLSLLLLRLAVAEFAAVSLTACVTGLIYFRVILFSWPPLEAYISSALLIAGLVLLVSLAFRHYARLQAQALHQFLWNGVGAVALAFSFFLSILFLLKMTEDYSRATFFFQLITVAMAVLGLRAVAYARIQTAIAAGRIRARRVVLVGDPAHHSEVAKRLADAGIETLRSLPFPARYEDSVSTSSTAINQGNSRRMIEICRTLKPNDIVILSTAADMARSARLADVLSELPVSVHMIPVGAGDLLGTPRLGELCNLVTIQLLNPPLSGFDRAVKRAFDIAAASMGLLIFSPLLIVASVTIKLDSRGPILFRQTRHGYNNDVIQVFKLRSMTTMEDGNAFTQARRNDPRVTRVGRLLRRFNLDELPQLLNVLIGDMSIVGPRPHPIALNQMFEQHISPLSRRHNVKPGITGWAQVNGYRGETDTLDKMQRRFEHDLYYIDNWSFMLDMKIILMTLFSKSAYMNAF
jgi:Undecaprenyl-phosphate glucose phosphotransferase